MGQGPILLELFPFVILNGVSITFCFLMSWRIIYGISSNFANTFISIWPILLIKIKGWGPILLELFLFMILNGFCIEPFVFLIS